MRISTKCRIGYIARTKASGIEQPQPDTLPVRPATVGR